MTGREKLLSLHRKAVKAAVKYEAATPQTRTKEKLFRTWQNAEDRFEAAALNIQQRGKE